MKMTRKKTYQRQRTAMQDIARARQIIRDEVKGYFGDLHGEQTAESIVRDHAAVHRELAKEVERHRSQYREDARSDPEGVVSWLESRCRQWEEEAETLRLTASDNKDNDNVRVPALSHWSRRRAQVRFVQGAMSKALPGGVQAIALAGVDAFLDSLKDFPFLERDRIAHPLFDGHDELITLDLAGLVAMEMRQYTELRDALRGSGGNPEEEKFRQLPSAVYETAYHTRDGETFDGLLGRIEYALRQRGIADTPRRSIKVNREDSYGNLVERRIQVPREVPLHDDDGETAGGKPLPSRHAKQLPGVDDGFTANVLGRLELGEVFNEVKPKPTARQYDMTLRREIDEEPVEQIADEYGVRPSTVYNTVAQTQRKFRAARGVVRRPKD